MDKLRLEINRWWFGACAHSTWCSSSVHSKYSNPSNCLLLGTVHSYICFYSHMCDLWVLGLACVFSYFFFFLVMKHSEGVGVNDVPLLFQVFSSWYLCVGWKISASVCYISCFCCSVGKKPGKAIWRRYADLMKIASENALFSFRLMSWANGFQLFKSKP